MNIETWKRWAASVKHHIYALYLASRDSRVPLLAKILIGVVIAYALSPIDLIPDFIPVIGYLDDLVLVPLGIWLAIRLIPREVWEECKREAELHPIELPQNRIAALIVIFLWVLAILGLILWGLILWVW